MLNDFIVTQIRRQLPFSPNMGQEELLHKLGAFLLDDTSGRCFVLRGYAGTGKTSVVSALTRAMKSLNRRFVLLAPTGRAAKVIAAYSGFPAYTIHKRIYRQKRMGDDVFALSANLSPHTLFIVDEASMIANQADSGTFGSGRLLDDLIRHVYSAVDCALLFLGDDAQLPPVGQITSPALSADNLRGYGLQVQEHVLTEVARQALDSGILYNATRLREQLATQQTSQLPTLQVTEFSDMIITDGSDLVDLLESSYSEVGEEETIILSRTNKRTNLYNNNVRARVLWRDDEIGAGDRLMVTQNNYFWSEQYEDLPFLANGDMLEVMSIHHEHEMYGFRFAEASLHSMDYDWEIDVMLWLDTLHTDSPDQHYGMRKELFARIAEDYPELAHKKRDLIKKVMESPYYNALQVRFAYCVTCHKAQGGQWKHVYIDPGMVSDEHLGEEFYRWFYTALTRAQEKVILVGNNITTT